VRILAAACLLALAFLGLLGCAAGEQPQSVTDSPTDTTTTSVTDDNAIQGTGTIRYVDLEGGFYGLVAEDGTKYDPMSLPDSLQVDGLHVRFRGTEKNVMTTRMWGTPVELVSAERIDDKND